MAMEFPRSEAARRMAVKSRLVQTGGRLVQDFGFNRVAGEVLACLYLTDGEASLDRLERELGLSKAAVSLAAAQLERMGLIHRVRKGGDRKRYYRSADDIGSALRHGILKFTRSKLAALEMDLQQAEDWLGASRGSDPESGFLASRVERLEQLNRRARRLLEHPLLKLVSKLG